MSEHDDLFAGFAVLEPSAEESARAITRTRAAILATAIEDPSATQSAVVLATNQPSQHPMNDKALSRRAKRLSFLGLATVASLLFMFAAVVLMNSRSALAWSDIVRRMTGAKSLHCVMEIQTPDGKWIPSWEMKYDYQRGFLERYYDEQGLERFEVDNGESHWVHRRGQKIATRQSGVSAADQLEKLLTPLAAKSPFQPEPAKDELVDGTRWRCLTMIDEPRQSRASIWVDENNRLRRASVDRSVDGQWLTWCRVLVTYDVEIDGAEFTPLFEEGVKVVDLGKLFEEVCPIEEAVHRQEQFGYIFAIHELKRLGDFEYYILVSLRPTDETRRKLALQQGEYAGQLFQSMRFRHHIPVEHETAGLLAKARANGIEVSAYFVKLGGFDLQRMTRARPQFRLNVHPKLWSEFRAFQDIQFDVPLPDRLVSNEEAVRSLYETIAALEAVPMDELCLHDPLDDRVFNVSEARRGETRKTTRRHMPRPSEISFEEFFEHFQKQHLGSPQKTTVKE